MGGAAPAEMGGSEVLKHPAKIVGSGRPVKSGGPDGQSPLCKFEQVCGREAFPAKSMYLKLKTARLLNNEQKIAQDLQKEATTRKLQWQRLSEKLQLEVTQRTATESQIQAEEKRLAAVLAQEAAAREAGEARLAIRTAFDRYDR